MKFVTALLLLAAVATIVVDAYIPKMERRNPGFKPFPTFPGHGPYNPFPRSRRSPHNRPPVTQQPDPHGHINAHAVRGGGQKSSWTVEAERKIYENKHGDIHVYGRGEKQPWLPRPQAEAGIGGRFRFPG